MCVREQESYTLTQVLGKLAGALCVCAHAHLWWGLLGPGPELLVG